MEGIHLKGRIDIVTDPVTLQKLVQPHVAGALQKYLEKLAPKIERKIRIFLDAKIVASETYVALRRGKLTAEFGLTTPTQKIDTIINQWLRSVRVIVQPVRAKAHSAGGGLIVRAIQSDWQDVINLPEALQLTEKGELLPWLQWLLTSGGAILIHDWWFKYIWGTGRSYRGIMIPTAGSSWDVPYGYAGTENDNWITRILVSSKDELEKLIINTVQRG
jgi:hypothetical protein